VSDLRDAAMTRAGHTCEFPDCHMPGPLEMAHLKGKGMGGSRYRDVLNNVAVLCKFHHGWLDGALLANGRRFENEQIMRAYLVRPWKERR